MSKIEWTEKTWNIVTGCTKISEGCQNCYAEKMTKRLAAMGQNKYSAGFDKVVFHSEELNRVFGKNKMVFVNSMSDTFHKDITNLEIGYILTSCQLQPWNIFQLLTKRSERLEEFFYPKNVWLGVTVENINHKNRIDHLKKADAKIKFLSCEPLLGDLGIIDLTGIDWVIVGGESGHKARPMHPDWVRNIQRQCAEQGVSFFFKQWGEIKHCPSFCTCWKAFCLLNNGDVLENNTDAGIKDYLDKKDKHLKWSYWNSLNPVTMAKVGKKKAGRLLDGKEYSEYPKFN